MTHQEIERIEGDTERDIAHALTILDRPREFGCWYDTAIVHDNLNDAAETLTRAAKRLALLRDAMSAA